MNKIKTAEIIAQTGAYFLLNHKPTVCFSFPANTGIQRYIPAISKLTAGDPIDILTGQVVEQRTDFTLGQTLPLSFIRTWARSKDERHADGLCGRYWVDNFSEYAEISGNGQHIKIATCEGTYLRFALPIGSLQSVNPDHPQFTLTRHRDFLELYDRERQFAKYFHISTARFEQNNDDLGYPLLEDGRFRLAYWQDDFDNRVSFHYADAATSTSTSPARLIQVSHSDGIELRLRYQGEWLHQIIRTDGEQQEVLVTYQQDERGALLEADALLDFHLFYTYDNAFNLTRWADNDKTWVLYEYDEQGRCVHSIGAEGFYPVWFQFEENRTTVYNGKRQATVYDYDSHLMLPLAITSPNGVVTRFEYDRYGNLLRQTLPDGNQLCFDYFEQTGLVTCFTDTLGNQWQYEYDEHEQLCKLTDPLQRVWTKTESKTAEKSTALFTAPDGSQTEFIRNAFGLLTEVCSTQGSRQQREHFHYDPRHRLIESQDSEQRRIQLGYNDKDQLTQFTNPNGKSWRYAYNHRHKLSRINRPNHSHEQQAYDRHGNLIQYTDANGVMWQLKYGAFDLLTEKIDGEGNRWQYDYDKDSLKLCQVTNPHGETYRYRFNENDQVVEEIDFADNRWLYTYNPNGTLQSLTDGEGNVTHYEYDQGYRLIRLMSQEDNITYDYDKVGRVTAIDTLYSHLRFEYDSLDRIVRETQNGNQIDRTFDDENQTVTRTLHLQGKSETEAETKTKTIATLFKYNRVGELIELFLPETSGQKQQLFCNYDDNGNEVERRSNHGFIYKQRFNEMDMPTQQRAGWEPKIFDKEALRATGIDAPTFAELNRTYRYDAALNTIEVKDSNEQLQFYLNRNNQITSVNQKGNPSELYAYDRCGYLTQQRQSPHGNLFAQHEQANNRLVQNPDIYKKGNQLNRLQNEHYAYDNAGRLITKTQLKDGFRKQETTYRWNSHNQLTGLTNPRGEAWYYKYDGLGRRIAKQCPEKRINVEYIWDGDQLAYTITEKNGKLESERHSIFNGWELIAQQDYYSEFQQTPDGNKTEWKHQTHYAVTQPNGQVISLFDPEGKTGWHKPQTTLWGLDLDFGNYRTPSPLDPNTVFAGQFFDQESGLVYNRFRYYDPETANYLCPDSIGLNGGEMPYGYVSNPWDWLDLFGLAGCSITLGKNMMESMGLPRSTSWAGHQAHHIIPVQLMGHPALKKIGYNIDDATNGIFLRKVDNQVSAVSRHQGNHAGYTNAVKDALDKINLGAVLD